MGLKNKHWVYVTGSIAGLAFDPDFEPYPIRLNHYIKVKIDSVAYYYSPSGFVTDLRLAAPFPQEQAYTLVNKIRSYCRKNDIEIIPWASSFQNLNPDTFNRSSSESFLDYITRIVFLLKSLNWLTPPIMKNLTDSVFCKTTFDMDFPFFSENPIMPNLNAYNYNMKYGINGKKYYLFKNWNETVHEEKLQRFIIGLLQTHDILFKSH